MDEERDDREELRAPHGHAADGACANGAGTIAPQLIDPNVLLYVITSTAEQGILVHDGERVIASNSRIGELLDVPNELFRPGTELEEFIQYGIDRGDYAGASTLDVETMREIIRSCRSYRTERQVPNGRTVRIDARHKGGYAVATYTDVTDACRREDELRRSRATVDYLATHDSLTGLANRRAFDTALARTLQRFGARAVDDAREADDAGRSGGMDWRLPPPSQPLPAPPRGEKHLALLMIDLDRFKCVNDKYGHNAGDALLKATAERFQRLARSGDLIARLGGDEFALIVEVERPQHAVKLAQRLCRAAGEPVEFDGLSLHCGASVGVAFAGPTTRTPDQLLHAADVALYSIKHKGRNGVALANEALANASSARVRLETQLLRALESDQIVVHYQPQVDLTTNTVVGYEALMRWQHPERGMLGPDEFVPIAEENGLILELGRFVLQRATADFAALDEPHRLSINVSANQLADPSLANDVAHALRSSKLAPERLVIELTERALIADREKVSATLQALTDLGVALSLDDFGSQSSSIAYLTEFPFTRVKIDRRFIDRMLSDTRSSAVVVSILGLAASLDLRVTAEGVERAGELMALASAHCHEAQGFYFGHPEPIEAVRPQRASSARPIARRRRSA